MAAVAVLRIVIIGGILVLGGLFLLFLMFRRRR